MAQSTPKLAIKEMAVNSSASKTSIIGTDVTASNNVMLRRGGVGEIEVVKADDVTTEGIRSVNKVQVNVKNALIGTNVTLTNNVKLHRGGNGELGFVLGDDTQTEGNRSINHALVQAKSVVLGDSPNQSFNVKMRRAGSGIVQFVLGNDSFADGTLSPNYAHVLGSIPVGAVVAWNPGYYLTGANGTFVKADFIATNTIAGANTYLNTLGFWVADGTAPSITGTLIWNAAGRYLPNLSDDRFLMGSTVAGGIGGDNAMATVFPTYSFNKTDLNTNQVAHSHGMAHVHQHTFYTNSGGNFLLTQTNTANINSSDSTGWTFNGVMEGDVQSGTGAKAFKNTTSSGHGLYTSGVASGVNGVGASALTGTSSVSWNSTTVNTTATGGSSSTENRPKYLGTYFIVRVF